MPSSLIIPKQHAAAASALQFNRTGRVGTALILMLAAMACERTEAAGTLYMNTLSSLKRVSTEGDCRQMIQEGYAGNIGDVALDPEAGKVYFTFEGIAQRCDLDGANMEMVFPGPLGTFDIDPVNRKIYWGASDHNNEYQIMRANLDGSSIEQVIGGLSATGSTGFAVDPSGAKVYWVQRIKENPPSGSIHRVNFDGTAHEQIEVSEQRPFDIAVHHPSGKVFWTDTGWGLTLPGGVYRANLDFSDVEQIVLGLGQLTGMSIDEPAGMLYLCRQQPNGVFRCDLNGGGLVALGLQATYDIAVLPEELGFECFGDTNSDLHVNIDDILDVVGSWGPCRECPTDFNGDGTVNIADLLYVISHWTS